MRKKRLILLSAGAILLLNSTPALAEETTTEVTETQVMETEVNEVQVKEPNTTNDLIKEDSIIEPNAVVTPQYFDMAWGAGTGVVRNMGHNWTADLMTRARANPTDIYYTNISTPADLIRNDASFKTLLRGMKSQTLKTKPKTFTSSSVFTTGQLQSAINKYNYSVTISYDTVTDTWYYSALITDVYDFDYDLSVSAYGNNFKIALANNVAAYGESTGRIKPYDITVQLNGTVQ